MKPRFSLLDTKFILELIAAMENGAAKYGVENWKEIEPMKFRDALFRHYASFCAGETVDKDSGLSNLAHIAANAMILFALQNTK